MVAGNAGPGFGRRILTSVRAGRRTQLQAVAWSGFLTILIVIPWLTPGYIFATDFAGPRHFSLPDGPASYAGLQAALALFAWVLPAEVVGKLFVVLILVAAGAGAFSALPVDGFEPRAVAALIFVFNPFVYDRLAYGQLTVLAGYAVLPWVAASIRSLLEEPTLRNALQATALLTVVSILDIHLALIAAAATALLIVAYVATTMPTLKHLLRIGRQVAIVIGVVLIASSYWLVAIAVGSGSQARTLGRIGPGDLPAFSTLGDPTFGVVGNVLGLYGFWAEDTGRFTLNKDFASLWPVALFAIIGLAIAGAVIGWRQGAKLRFWVAGMAAVGIVAIVLDIGIASTYVAPIIGLLNDVFPPYRGMRDAGKWGGLLALAYAQLVPIAVGSTLEWTRRHLSEGVRRDCAVALVTAIVMALPLYYGNGLLYGIHGEIRPSMYPSGWYAADAALTADPNPGRAVFLPFHGYMDFSFIRNQNRVVASPAPSFFSIPVVASQDLEVQGVEPPLDDPDQALLAGLVASGSQADWGQKLSTRGFKYVLLARELDWETYGFLDNQPHLILVRDYGSILLYRNREWT